MGLQIPDYPHPLLTSLLSHPGSQPQFLSLVRCAMASNCDGLFTPIFPDQYLEQLAQAPLELDHCFLLCDQYLKRDQLRVLNPVVNEVVWGMERRAEVVALLLGYSSYLNLRSVALDLHQGNAQAVLDTLRHPLVSAELGKSGLLLTLIVRTSALADEQADQDDRIWNNYITFRQGLEQMKFPMGVELALVIQPNAPLNRVINRWKSEKIVHAIFERECFVQNAKGYTILPAKHERLMHELVLVRGAFGLHYQIQSGKSEKGEKEKDEQDQEFIEDCYKFVQYSFRKFTENKTKNEKQAIYLMDYLQNPLQPYADNLESATYQVFQFDQPKYKEYEDALETAFEKFPKNKKIIVYYIGAGRGGLLFNAFAAARKTHRKIYVYAIEKNPYPIQTIKKRIRENKWSESVRIVHTDIRNYEMPQKPDVFLSELLGGFGDNELSPECLFWAEKNIAPETICVPSSYTAYIRPVSYSGVHRKILPGKAREIYYTVYFGSYYTNFACQEVWRFEHPIRRPALKQSQQQQQIQQQQQSKHEQPSQQAQQQQQVFNRYSKTSFQTKQDIVIDGFAGYFTSVLYGHAQLSILPERPTLGMFSWFPLFFSFQQREYLSRGASIEIELWRKGGQKRVWYEWRYSIGGRVSQLHNQSGNSVAIQL